MADAVIRGEYGVGEDRKNRLESEGYDYNAIQDIVNQKMEALKPKKSNEEMADLVIRGDYGVGEDRKNRLTAEGYDYDAIQAIVNQKMSGQKIAISPAKSRDT
jgi:RIO-like serine/threonine protein kinase